MVCSLRVLYNFYNVFRFCKKETIKFPKIIYFTLNLFGLGFLRVAVFFFRFICVCVCVGGGGGGGWRGGGGRKVPSRAAHNSKTINDNRIKFGGVVENHKLINLI